MTKNARVPGRSRILAISTIMGMTLGICVGMTSCLIPDTEICVLVECGDGWCGQAFGARGAGPSGGPIDIIDFQQGDFPETCVCLAEAEHEDLEDGIQLGCHEETAQVSCEMITGCEWSEGVGSTEIDLCLPEDLGFQAGFFDIVNSVQKRCEDVAVENLVEPYPECDDKQSQGACVAVGGCEWDAVGSVCEFPYDTCETAAIQTALTAGPACIECYNDCNIGGDDGGETSAR